MNMSCPRCTDVELVERSRDGVVVDGCVRCRGVWLDRGELEKLIANASRELERSDEHYESAPPSSDRRRGGYEQGKYPRRKRSLLESLGDIFD